MRTQRNIYHQSLMIARRYAFNRADLLGAAVVVLLVTALLMLVSFSPGAQTALFSGKIDEKIYSATWGAWGAIVIAIAGAALRITSLRQSLIRLFLSEIKAMQYGLSTMSMFEFWRQIHDAPEKGAVGFADVPRAEDYFQTYAAVGENIGNLHAKVVEAVIRYYMYLKMSRDAASALHSWNQQHDVQVRKIHVAYVVRLLSLSMIWGFVALWYMGFAADPTEAMLWRQIRETFRAVFGEKELAELIHSHPQRRQLCRFFGVAGPAFDKDAR